MNSQAWGWMGVGTLAVGTAVAAWLWIVPPSAAKTEVRADRGAVAAGRDVVVGRDLVMKEYDLDEKQRRDANAFATGFGRECRTYLSSVRAVALERPKDRSVPDALTLGVGGGYFSPDMERVLGADAYRRVNDQMDDIRKLSGDLFQLRMKHGTTRAFNMEKQARGQPIAELAEFEAQFATGKQELIAATVEHCDYLDSLKR